MERQQYVEEVAAYVRVSHDEQKLHGLSLDAQVNALTKYADEHNMKIVGWYRDEGVSGRKLIKKRPELQRMIQDAEQKKFKRIIFIKLDRFFRSVAEYHECMKRLSTGDVIWTATEEKYDLSTASGEAFVNMKLTMAQFEADQAGERIRMVNEYKIQTGQPLFGSHCFPFCYEVGHPEDGDRHKYVQKRDEKIMRDLIDHVMKNHSIRSGLFYINQKYNRTFGYNAISRALRSEMLYGCYKGNPNYCEPYITKEEYDRLQEVIRRNPRTSSNEYYYIFTGLVRCPECGRLMQGAVIHSTKRRANGKKDVYRYYGYRCRKHTKDRTCNFSHVVFERRLETEMLSAVEKIVDGKRVNLTSAKSSEKVISKHNLEALQQELERLNYAWKKGRIKNVEEYDRDYDELIAKINAAQAEQDILSEEPDYEQIRQILSDDWKTIYSNLDAEHKRSFWRSFVEEIHVEWNKQTKRVIDINFFS